MIYIKYLSAIFALLLLGCNEEKINQEIVIIRKGDMEIGNLLNISNRVDLQVIEGDAGHVDGIFNADAADIISAMKQCES